MIRLSYQITNYFCSGLHLWNRGTFLLCESVLFTATDG